MNNLKKLGVTALAGSLAAVSAQAGEMSMNGSANFTYYNDSSKEGKGIGTDKGLTVSGSGELDNGWTFAISTYFSDALGISSHSTSLTMGSLGTVTAGQAWGGNSTSYDEEVPQVYEQTSDRQQNSANQVGNWMDNGGLTWVPPAFDLGGLSVQAHLGFSPDADDAATNNGSVADKSGTWGMGTDLGLTISTDMGLTLGAYVAERENELPRAAGDDAVRDEFNGSWFAKYSAGPVSIGYSQSYYDGGTADADGESAVTAAATAKAVGTSNGIFENEQMSIAFNVNDNLSISYTDSEDTYDAQDNASTAIADVEQNTDALQVAYSMGGMSIKAFKMESSNPGWDSDAAKTTFNEISIGLAF
jgi:outer membrane protein OmpU